MTERKKHHKPTAKGLANLQPVKTKEEARARGKNGGIKSGEVRRVKKTLKQSLEILLERTEKGEELTNQERMIMALFQKALTGSEKAFEVVRDTIGQKLTDKLEVTGQVQKVYVTKEEEEEANKHIDDMINGNYY